MEECIKILFHIYMNFNVFRATYRWVLTASRNHNFQQTIAYAKPEAVSAVVFLIFGGVSP
jgi:hypothetical protein